MTWVANAQNLQTEDQNYFESTYKESFDSEIPVKYDSISLASLSISALIELQIIAYTCVDDDDCKRKVKACLEKEKILQDYLKRGARYHQEFNPNGNATFVPNGHELQQSYDLNGHSIWVPAQWP